MQNKIKMTHNHTDSMHDNEITLRDGGYFIIAVMTYQLSTGIGWSHESNFQNRNRENGDLAEKIHNTSKALYKVIPGKFEIQCQ